MIHLSGSYRVYASVYNVPDEGKVKAHLIIILDGSGNLIDYFPGPVTIDAYNGRFTKKVAKASVKAYFVQSFKEPVSADPSHHPCCLEKDNFLSRAKFHKGGGKSQLADMSRKTL